MTKKILIIVVIFIIVVGAGVFYGGMKYGQSRNSGGFSQRNFNNLSAEQRQQMAASGGAFRGRSAENRGDSFSAGEIISKDDKSITIKLVDGGSKIIFFSDSTDIVKSVKGTANDFISGEQVVVNGNKNGDGSITAQSIQIRPQPQTQGNQTQGNQ